jgi:precorrin-6Y C5,15-methyltransferase (decarboxylating)
MTVTVIGCDGSALTPAASAALAGASVVAGARRHLVSVTVPPAAERIVIQHLDTALDAICAARAPAAVLASGDPGFFGIVRALRARGVTPVVIPAVSSVALAFARLGLDWTDALVLSAHGRAAGPVLAAALAHPKAAILTGPPEAATGQLRSALLAAGRTVYAAERLGAPGERVRNLARHSAPEVTDPHVLISLAGPEPAPSAPEPAPSAPEPAPGGLAPAPSAPEPAPSAPEPAPGGLAPAPSGLAPAPSAPAPAPGGLAPAPARPEPVSPAAAAARPAAAPGPASWLAGHQGAPAGWALPEADFEHRDSMITKAEVRALVLARLGPGPGRTIWDVGAGSGSVAVECARFGAWAIAVESDEDQCGRIRRNAAAHGVLLQVVAGRAPDVLAGLPAPDAVFAGGGDDDVLAAAVKAGQPGRVVVTLVSVDRVRGVCEMLAGSAYEVNGTQLQAARLAGLPGGSLRLAAANPVFVIWADQGKEPGLPAGPTAQADRAGRPGPGATS